MDKLAKPALQKGTYALVLAPMEGVTDAPMRALLSEGGGLSYCVAEYLRINQQIPPATTFLKHVPELARAAQTTSGVPVQVQLLGGSAERLAQAAQAAYASGATAVDLNFGCPARTVNRHDGGAALLKFPQRIFHIVEAVRNALPASIPVSVKLRLGWDDAQAIHLNADMAAAAGASWITIHGRTRMQGYKPPAFWAPIGEVRARLSIPIVANGEIWTLDDFRRCQDVTGCEHFMLGRGALANPRLIAQIAAELHCGGRGRDVETAPHASDWANLIRHFVRLVGRDTARPQHLPGRIKQWLKMSHQKFGNPWYERVKTLKTLDDILAVLRN